MALNPKQECFCVEYVVDFNATKAAKRAGYAESSAHSQAHDLLKKPEVKARIQEHIKERFEAANISVERVLTEIALMGHANMVDYTRVLPDGTAVVDLSDLTRDQFAAIQEVVVDEYMEGRGEDAREVKKVKVKLADKKGNLELLGRYLKMFTDRVEHSGSISVNGVNFATEES